MNFGYGREQLVIFLLNDLQKLRCMQKCVRNDFQGADVRAQHTKIHRNPTSAKNWPLGCQSVSAKEHYAYIWKLCNFDVEQYEFSVHAKQFVVVACGIGCCIQNIHVEECAIYTLNLNYMKIEKKYHNCLSHPCLAANTTNKCNC